MPGVRVGWLGAGAGAGADEAAVTGGGLVVALREGRGAQASSSKPSDVFPPEGAFPRAVDCFSADEAPPLAMISRLSSLFV